jgi:hypothetical protein
MNLVSSIYQSTESYINFNSATVSSSDWFFGDKDCHLIYHDLYVNANRPDQFDLCIAPNVSYYSVSINKSVFFGLQPSSICNFCDFNPQLLKIRADTDVSAYYLVFGYCRNYFHWVFDVMPRLFVQEGERQYQILTSKSILSGFQRQYIDLVESRVSKILTFEDSHLISLEGKGTIVFPSCRKDDIFGGSRGSRTELINRLRFFLLSEYAYQDYTYPNKIFISRKDASNGVRLNDSDAIETHFENQGFEIIQLSSMSVIEQINLFYNANIIAAPHGAALANLIFCKPGTTVYELYDNLNSTIDPNPDFEYISRKKWWGKWCADSSLIDHQFINMSHYTYAKQ